MRITYADREQFLRTLTTLKNSLSISDDKLLQDVGEWATRIKPQYGFEEALARDVLILSNYLGRHRARPDVADIARGALAYVLRAEESGDPRLPSFGLFDDAFVASFAVHEIQTRLGDAAQYSPPKLTPIEQRHAEEIFLELLDNCQSPDLLLPDKAMDVVKGLGILAESGILRRLRNNVVFLSGILRDSSRSAEHRGIARAALEYLVRGEDAIPDELGIAGFIDDNFIGQLAVDLIEPLRDPWLEVLDALLASWPFLSNLFLGEGDVRIALSEFLLLNSALTCPPLRGPLGARTTSIVTPSPGPLPFVLGFVSALGAVYEASREDASPRIFTDGQKVIVDFTSIRVFAGYRTINDQQFFGLKQTRRERGQTLATIAWWPISEIRRLVPAPAARSTRGSLTSSMDRNDAAIPALDVLLSLPQSHSYALAIKPVLLAAPIAYTRALAETLRIFDQPLCDIVPMAHLSGTEEIVRWSPRLGSQNPALITTSDLDYACEYFDETRIVPRLVIIDGSGKNASRQASVARLASQNVPVVIVSDYGRATLDATAGDQHDFVWTWTREDFETILAPEDPRMNPGGLVLFERTQRRAFLSSIDEKSVVLSGSAEVFRALTDLRAHLNARGDDRAPEIDEFLATGFRCYLRLLRLFVPLQDLPALRELTETDLVRLRGTLDRNRFLTGHERNAMQRVNDGLRGIVSEISSANPKGNEMRTLLHGASTIAIVCQDPEAVRDPLLNALNQDIPLLSPEQAADRGRSFKKVIVPGWLGQRTMTDLLMPPVADSVLLVLDSVERGWYTGFRHIMREASSGGQRRTTRGQLFPGIIGWRGDRPQVRPVLGHPEETLHEAAEALHSHVREATKNRFLTRSGPETEKTVEAHFVMFEERACAFLAKGYRAKVATHLLNGECSGEEAEIELRPVSQLVAGDAVLFLRGSERDVIRAVADTMVPAGTRNLASLWKTALRLYSDRNFLNAEQLRDSLNGAGCPLGVQAIRNWLADDDVIGPLAYSRDLSVIAGLTKDEALCASLEASKDSIARLRSAHLRASHVLAQQVLGRTVASLRSASIHSSINEDADRVVIVRVADIDQTPVRVRTSLVNRLLEDTEWLE